MFERKTTTIFAVFGIAIVLGFICGVAPGVFLQSYALLGIGSGFLLLILIILIITLLIIEYQNKNEVSSTLPIHINLFNKRLTSREKTSLTFAASLTLIAGVLLGVLCELLLKAISVSFFVHIIVAAIFILLLLILFIALLISERTGSRNSEIDNRELYPVLVEPVPHSQVSSKSQDGSQNTVTRSNRSRPRYIDTDSRYVRQDSPVHNSITHSTQISKPTSTIQKEYQKLLNSSSRFYINEKVYVNDNDIAEIIEADGLGNYRVQYLNNGLIDFKTGAELRKALPLIS